MFTIFKQYEWKLLATSKWGALEIHPCCAEICQADEVFLTSMQETQLNILSRLWRRGRVSEKTTKRIKNWREKNEDKNYEGKKKWNKRRTRKRKINCPRKDDEEHREEKKESKSRRERQRVKWPENDDEEQGKGERKKMDDEGIRPRQEKKKWRKLKNKRKPTK